MSGEHLQDHWSSGWFCHEAAQILHVFLIIGDERRGGSWERQAPAPPPMDR